MARQVKRGNGWQLGWNPDAEQFRGLVGGSDWAIELTEAELDDFCRLLQQLSQTLRQLSHELMDEEKVCCEAESDRIWVEVEGFPEQFTVRFLVLTGRGAEGSWPASVVPELIQATQMLKVF